MTDERDPGTGRDAAEAGQPVGPGAQSVGPGTESPGGSADAPVVQAAESPEPVSDGDASLLALVDRLAAILDRSELAELEVEAGGTALLLRKPVALAAPLPVAPPPAHAEPDGPPAGSSPGGASDRPASHDAEPRRPSVKAPLTGIYYGSPSPGATPYVSVGDHVSVGQVIGLIEAMKLFNEIKSDLAGRVARIVAENGALVKAKQPLVEIEP